MSIHFEKVRKSFGNRVILDSVSFTVDTGKILFILGKSGVGKSVTLKNIVGLLKPDSGNVTICDAGSETYVVNTLNEVGLAKVRTICGMVFQHPALLDSLTVLDNVGFGIQYMTAEDRRKRVLECLHLVHLDESILQKRPPEISYGMQKRVSLARTLAPGPRYLLFDEPTTGLDPITTRAVDDLISELSRKLHVTSIVVSHDMNSALRVADKILVLDQGGILAFGSVEEIKNHPAPLIREFLAEVL